MILVRCLFQLGCFQTLRKESDILLMAYQFLLIPLTDNWNLSGCSRTVITNNTLSFKRFMADKRLKYCR